ncbi:MAG TPA: 16S rRNA (uracil(1498)-N(3))-methyltransferase [Pyrinomonadaceae bacterium]|nr:16S rRNA (uracil(1498)-N(3))-methyltransferase [Pyrinomonadaceae bacterium]
MKRFYAPPEQFDGQIVRLAVEETRHLRDVLRMKAGEQAQVFDGNGREFLAEVGSIGKRETFLKIIEKIDPPAPESDLDLTLAACAYKNDKFDLVVQKAVELGVARLAPMVSFRSEVYLQATAKRTERWRKIALEATKQCERAKVMQIDEPLPFIHFVSGINPDSRLLLMFSEKDGKSIPEETGGKMMTALIGPKGGWEDSEIELATERGFIPVKLGRRIMRAETAAITFAALLQHRFGDLN